MCCIYVAIILFVGCLVLRCVCLMNLFCCLLCWSLIRFVNVCVLFVCVYFVLVLCVFALDVDVRLVILSLFPCLVVVCFVLFPFVFVMYCLFVWFCDIIICI